MKYKLDHPYNAVRCPFCNSWNTILSVPHGHEIKRLLVERYWKMWCYDCLGDFMVDKESKSGRKIVRKGRKAVGWNGRVK